MDILMGDNVNTISFHSQGRDIYSDWLNNETPFVLDLQACYTRVMPENFTMETARAAAVSALVVDTILLCGGRYVKVQSAPL